MPWSIGSLQFLQAMGLTVPPAAKLLVDDVITRNRCVNLDGALVRTARGLGISLGD